MPNSPTRENVTHPSQFGELEGVLGSLAEIVQCFQLTSAPSKAWPVTHHYWTKYQGTVSEPLRFDPYFQHSSQLAWATMRQIAISGMTFSPTEEADIRSYAVPLSEVFRTAAKECPSIKIDPDVMAGAPCINGTRIPVYGVLDAIEHHGTLDGVLKSYPRLTIDQVKDAVMFAKLVVECPLED